MFGGALLPKLELRDHGGGPTNDAIQVPRAYLRLRNQHMQTD